MKTSDFQSCLRKAQRIVKRYRRLAPKGFDVYASIVSGTVGAILGSNAQSDANATNASNVANTNALNYRMYEQSRGSTGSSIFPVYAAGAENELYNDALSSYDATGALSPTPQTYQNIVSSIQPIAAGAQTAAAGVFNGNTLNQELTNEAPVAQANLDLATSQKSATLLALNQTLNNIKAIQAGKGYAGDSFGNQLLSFQARAGANTTGALALGTAKLQNAQTVQGIQQNAINRQLQDVNLPNQIASNNLNLSNAASSAAAQNTVTRQNILSNFRIGPGQPFQYSSLPTVQPNSAGYGALSNVGSFGNNLASAYIKNPQGVSGMFGIGAGGGGNGGGTSTGGVIGPDGATYQSQGEADAFNIPEGQILTAGATP